jgi:hypothetical protein
MRLQGDNGTDFRFMTKSGNLAAFDLDEKTIIFNSLHAASDPLAFLEV